MPFYSSQFLALLAITYVAWLAVPAAWRWLVLLAASLVFLCASHPWFLVPLLGATLFAFLVAHRLASLTEARQRKGLLALAIVLLAANLTAFKYAGAFGVGLLLPLGISFYTFQLVGYLVDVYRGFAPERDLRVFSLFVLLFPKIVSGPIERASNLLPQLRQPRHFDYAQTVAGLQLILWGAFKKLVVADRLAPFVARVYDDPSAAEGPTTVAATVLYAFQLYCDFSGYTDMALGLAAVFGYKLVQNFNRPYAAISIQDFWKRWHISLTSWLTDYIYNPLIRQRLVKVKLYWAMLGGLFITFVISGLWHGSHWNFVAWGALHGAYIVLSLMFQKQRAKVVEAFGLARRPTLRKVIRVGITFSLVCLAYVLFRAPGIGEAGILYASLFQGWGMVLQLAREFVFMDPGSLLIAMSGVLVVILVEAIQSNGNLRDRLYQAAPLRPALCFMCAFTVAVAGVFGEAGQQFIYFSF